MAERVACWDRSEQDGRDRRAAVWREGRRRLDRHEPATRQALLEYWNGHRWLPGDPAYLLDMLHGFEAGRLIFADGQVRPAAVVIPVSAAAAAFGPSKPTARRWLGPSSPDASGSTSRT